MTATNALFRRYDSNMGDLEGAPYNWAGSGHGDCSGDVAKRVRQYVDGMPMEDILQGWADDYAKVLERMNSRGE